MKYLAFSLTVAAAALMATDRADAAVIDLGFSLDASGSVGSSNFDSARTALSQAIANIPTSGVNQYRIAVMTFDFGSDTIVAPTVVTDANIASIRNDVANAAYTAGGTNIAGAITTLFGLFDSSATGLGATTLLNVTTDGGSSVTASKNAALAARAAGLDGLSFEAVGFGPDLSSLREIAGLGTAGDENNGVIVDFGAGGTIPDATTTGFVINVSDFDAYAGAIDAKIDQIVDDTGGDGGGDGDAVIPLPAGLPLLLTGLAGIGLVARRRRA